MRVRWWLLSAMLLVAACGDRAPNATPSDAPPATPSQVAQPTPTAPTAAPASEEVVHPGDPVPTVTEAIASETEPLRTETPTAAPSPTPTDALEITGAVWLVDEEASELLVADASTGEIADRITFESPPRDVAVGAGAVWVAHDDGSVSQLDPVSGDLLTQLSTDAVRTFRIAASETDVWFTGRDTADDGMVLLVDTATPEYLGSINGGQPVQVAIGEDGVWVGNGQTITRLALGSGEVVEHVRVGGYVNEICIGGGRVWVPVLGGFGTDFESAAVVGIDPATNTVATTIDYGTDIQGCAFAEGSVWVADWGEGAVARIDAETEEVTAIPTGSHAFDVAAGAGAVWVLNVGLDPFGGSETFAPDSTLSRVDPVSGTAAPAVAVAGAERLAVG